MRKLFYLTVLGLLVSCNTSNKCEKSGKFVANIGIEDQKVNYYMNNLSNPFKVMFLADLHFTIEDERGADFYQYTKRMGGSAVESENYGVSNGRERKLMESLEKAKKEGVEMVVLGGDILNFPSKASVDSLLQIMNNSELKWMFISGNHDWHYEGESGESADLRDKWIEKNLKPLYQGRNSLYTSEIINDINFIGIDNSVFEITPEQLDFFQKEVNKGLPIILMMHIPLHLPEYENNLDYGCAHPRWNEANDDYYKIEQRIPWSKDGHTQTTYDFKELVLNAGNVIGVYAGHTHKRIVDIHDNIFQYVVDANYNGDDVIMNFNRVEK